MPENMAPTTSPPTPEKNKKAGRKFIFFPGLTIAVILSLIMLTGLGSWQLQRRVTKLELIAAVEERSQGEPVNLQEIVTRFNAGEDMRYARVKVSGRFDYAREAHVFGTLGPTPGYYIFTPLIIDTDVTKDKNPIYINRGFVPENLKDSSSRPDGQIDGIVEITGLFRQSEKRHGPAAWLAPNDQPEENIWYTRDPTRFFNHAYDQKAPPQQWYIDSLGTESSAEYPRGNTTRIEFNNRHLEYAFTWFGLALTLIGVWLAFSFKREENQEQ